MCAHHLPGSSSVLCTWTPRCLGWNSTPSPACSCKTFTIKDRWRKGQRLQLWSQPSAVESIETVAGWLKHEHTVTANYTWYSYSVNSCRQEAVVFCTYCLAICAIVFSLSPSPLMVWICNMILYHVQSFIFNNHFLSHSELLWGFAGASPSCSYIALLFSVLDYNLGTLNIYYPNHSTDLQNAAYLSLCLQPL